MSKTAEVLLVLHIPIHQTPQPADILAEVKRRADSLEPNEISYREIEPGKLEVTNTGARMLLGTITNEIAGLKKDLDEERTQRQREVAALRAEMRPYQDTTMLSRKGIFENLLKERNLHW